MSTPQERAALIDIERALRREDARLARRLRLGTALLDLTGQNPRKSCPGGRISVGQLLASVVLLFADMVLLSVARRWHQPVAVAASYLLFACVALPLRARPGSVRTHWRRLRRRWPGLPWPWFRSSR